MDLALIWTRCGCLH